MAAMAAVAIDDLAKVMGGKRLFRFGVGNDRDFRRSVEAGLPYASLEAVMTRFGFTRAELSAVLRLPSRTMARRRREGRLDADESDRLLRLARIASEAARILGTADTAAGWLRDENRALGYEIPLDLLRTDVGARQVEQILGRIEYGVFS